MRVTTDAAPSIAPGGDSPVHISPKGRLSLAEWNPDDDGQSELKVPSSVKFSVDKLNVNQVKQRKEAEEIVKMIQKKLTEIDKRYQSIAQRVSHQQEEERKGHMDEKMKASGTLKSQAQTTADLGGGGRFVRPESQNFDIIINILIGIRRSLSNLVEIPGK